MQLATLVSIAAYSFIVCINYEQINKIDFNTTSIVGKNECQILTVYTTFKLG
jgi:hypothetical protein